MLQGEELPDDILASLHEKRPRIVVDENKSENYVPLLDTSVISYNS